MSIDLTTLNPQQHSAVTTYKGPLIVLAGAGSGKTRVLTYKAAYLISEIGVDPSKILMVTFTNKAAGEMKQRLFTLVGSSLSPDAGTFHSFCARLLRKTASVIGISPAFTIYDEQDKIEAIKRAMVSVGLTSGKISPKSISITISQAKNELITPSEYQLLARGFFQESVALTYTVYEQLLNKNQAFDFDDLLLKAVTFLRSDLPLAKQFRETYEYILVDEYQDTNRAQYELTKLLASKYRNICIVGDASQSIYSFRGADFRNIMNFKQDFGDSALINLEQNYRSTQNILTAATTIISKNTSHPVLHLWTQAGNGDKITLYEARNEHDEAAFIIKILNKTLDNSKDAEYSDFAVLYRTNAQSRVIEEAFLHSGIPYTLVGGVRFYERKEIKDILSYLRFFHNSKDSVSYARIDKIGKKRLDKYLKVFERLKESPKALTTLELMDEIIKSCDYLSLYDGEDDEDKSRLENVKELRSVASEFPDLGTFLENVALIESEYLPSGRSTRQLNDENKNNRVTLLTIHAAKGLEFKQVFLVGMEEGLFPHSQSLLEKEEIEEERRLCYVAVTRAKHRLYISYAQKRLYFGKHTSNMPSRFLVDVPQSTMEFMTGYYD